MLWFNGAYLQTRQGAVTRLGSQRPHRERSRWMEHRRMLAERPKPSVGVGRLGAKVGAILHRSGSIGPDRPALY